MALPVPGSVTVAQDVLSDLVNQVAAFRLPPLGAAFSQMAGSELADALVAHRLTKKYAEPSEKDSQRRASSIASMLAYDAGGPTQVPWLRDIPPHIKRILYIAKDWLRVTLSDFRVSSTCRFPSGESHNTTFGWVDVINKLTTDSAWEVSLAAAPKAAAICYNNHQLKRLVKARFWASDMTHLAPRWYQEAIKAGRKPGFYVFTRMFLSLCNIVRTSRVTTVPKDNTVDRVITCEAFWNMVVQLSLAQDLRQCLISARGIYLETRQDLHRSLIANDSVATIDFSNASNSNWLCWLRFLWPPKVLSHILDARTGIFEVEDGDDVTYHPVRMLAPMGCGYTFEVMTLTLLAISRAFDQGSSVFGDDVIINRVHADGFCEVMQFLGWQINEKKTFVEGNFRESCGGFYSLSDRQHLVCYDFTWLEDLPDVFIAIQKIERILKAKQIGPAMYRLFACAYVKLLSAIPRDAIAEPCAVMRDDVCPTPLWERFADPQGKKNLFVQALQTFQWSMPRLVSSYQRRMQNRPVRDDEHLAQIVSSFYAMRSRAQVMSRKKEAKIVRVPFVDGAFVPLTEVGWFSMLT